MSHGAANIAMLEKPLGASHVQPCLGGTSFMATQEALLVHAMLLIILLQTGGNVVVL